MSEWFLVITETVCLLAYLYLLLLATFLAPFSIPCGIGCWFFGFVETVTNGFNRWSLKFGIAGLVCFLVGFGAYQIVFHMLSPILNSAW